MTEVYRSSRDELPSGTVVADRYRVEELIGSGGSGAVYRARQLGLDRDVAIKVLRSGFSFEEREVERFHREALATGRLRHPNIVTVHDFGELPDGRAYLVLEYLAGPPLHQWLLKRRHVPPDLAADILLPICRAIHASHANGVIHRDLKPSNVIPPPEEDWSTPVKVVDFGIARLSERDSTLTGDSTPGTPAYMAPEVIDGGQADPRSDVYSIGLIAYELLAGRLPFTGPTTMSFMFQHLSKEPPAPSSWMPEISAELDAVVLRALEKDPAKRFPSAEAFAEAFEDAVRSAYRTGEVAPVARPVRRSGPSVLVVDDDETILRVVRASLAKNGYEIEVAEDGVAALMMLGTRRFDLIISDIEMPNLDGFRLLELMSAKQIPTPVVFLTGHEGDEREVRGLELGAADFIRKPISPPVLLARVRRIVGDRSETQYRER